MSTKRIFLRTSSAAAQLHHVLGHPQQDLYHLYLSDWHAQVFTAKGTAGMFVRTLIFAFLTDSASKLIGRATKLHHGAGSTFWGQRMVSVVHTVEDEMAVEFITSF
jgi:hypothetical protein